MGLGGIATGGVLLIKEMTRPATNAEVADASSQEVASRWLRLPAGVIFLATIRYANSESITSTASLVGIARPASCAAALDATVARELRRLGGCRAVLRATYVDSSGTLAVTAGVAILASPSAVSQASSDLAISQTQSGIRAATFSGTEVEAFGDQQRASFGNGHVGGPYLFFFAAGYADGRILPSGSGNPQLSDLGYGVLAQLEPVLTSSKNPCKMKDIRC